MGPGLVTSMMVTNPFPLSWDHGQKGLLCAFVINIRALLK